MRRARFTPEYVAGIIGGMGVGLAIHPLIERWVAPHPASLSIGGVILACCGGFLAIHAQQRTAKRNAA